MVQALIALGLGAAAFVITDVATFYATTDMAKNGQRNRKIVAALGIAGGLYLTRKHPLLGLGVAVGSLLAGFGNAIDLVVLKMLPSKTGAPNVTAGLGAVHHPLGAVAHDDMRSLAYNRQPQMLGMGAVAHDDMRGWEPNHLGDLMPGPPWEQETPFGSGAGQQQGYF